MASNTNDNNPNKQTLKNRIYVNTLNFVAIFIIILFIIFGYYSNNSSNIKNTNTNNEDYVDIMKLFDIAINPCKHSQQYSCSINEYIDTNCSNRTPDDIDMFEYIIFILTGAYMLCTNVNENMVNTIGSGMHNITKNDSPLSYPKSIAFFMVIYLIFFYGMYGIKIGVVNSFFLYVFKKNYGIEFFYSLLSLFIFIFSSLLLINVMLYGLYLLAGVKNSTSNRFMYLFMIFAAGFVFWITGFKLTFVEGFREGAKNKKNKIQTKSSKSKKRGGASKCNDFNYVIPLAILLSIPIFATIKTFFMLIFSGFYGIYKLFTLKEDTVIWPSISKTFVCSIAALFLMWFFILIEKLIEVSK